VKLLLEAKASVTRNEEGKTPLDLARRRGKTEVMRILEAAA
jgi:ankyrin repeat protein